MSSEEDFLKVGQGENEDYVELLETLEQVKEGKRELDQLTTVSDSLEALIGKLDTVSHMTPEYADLVKVSCENLLIGTSYDYTFLVPSLESDIGSTVSTEGLRDRLSEIWKRIVSAILSVLASIKKMWVKIASFKGRLELSAMEVKRTGSANRSRVARNPTIEMGFNARTLCIGKGLVSDGDALVRATNAVGEQYKVVTNMYAKSILAVGASYEALLKRPTDDPRALLEDICAVGTQLPFSIIATSVRAFLHRDGRGGAKQIMMAPPVLGGYSLYINVPDDPVRGLTGNALLTMAQGQRTSGIRFSPSDIHVANMQSGIIKTANGYQAEALADKVLGLLKLIDTQEPARQLRKVEAQIKSLLSAADSFKSHPSVGEGNLVYSESILRHVRTYVSWANGPVDSMTTNLLTVSRAILIYAKNSLSN